MIVETRVVALGGGHGLAATLTSLRSITKQITAVVTVADNGGSSGRLRSEFEIMPPGDLRMALAALCGDDTWGRNWAEIMQYRFTSAGELDGHAIGNLLLTALWNRDEDVVLGLDQVGALLKVVGRVLPMTAEPLDIEATFESRGELHEAHGQVAVATTEGKLHSLRLKPESPTTRPEVIAAIADAEWITMGPGSWFSSVLPHLLVPSLRAAIANSPAKKILILNLDSDQQDSSAGEFAGHTPREHCEILSRYAPEIHFDLVIADSRLAGRAELQGYLRELGTGYFEADLRKDDFTIHHDQQKLASAFAHIAREILVG